MGFLSDFFSSPREKQAPGMYQGQLGSLDDILAQVSNMQNTEGGITDINSLRSKLGLTGVQDPFNIAKKNLATSKAQSLRAVSNRMGSSVANPEAFFSPVESDYAQSMGNLEGQEAQANIGEQQYEANFLDQILQRQNQFNMGKQQARAGVTGQKTNTIQDYLGSLSGASGLDDLLSVADTVSKFIPKAKSIPK